MQEDKEKSREFVRAILEPIIQKKINKVEIEGQKILQGLDVDKRGIQMDAYAKVYFDDNGDEITDISIKPKPIIYDIEPNKYPGDEGRRARLYHAIVDSKITKAGIKYNELSDEYVIMITPYDPFGLNRMVYTVKNCCIEEPDMPYEDGNTTIFVYAHGKKDIPSQELANMLKYVVESSEENAQRANLDNVHHMLEEIKSDKKLEEAYMQSWEIEGYFTELGRKEGLEAGRREGVELGENKATNRIAISMLRENKSVDEISRLTGLTVAEVGNLADSIGLNLV